MDSKSVKVKLEGYCCKNYQPVKEHLQKMLNSGGEENVQLCVYVKDKCVVDLYGTAIGKYVCSMPKKGTFLLLNYLIIMVVFL